MGMGTKEGYYSGNGINISGISGSLGNSGILGSLGSLGQPIVLFYEAGLDSLSFNVLSIV